MATPYQSIDPALLALQTAKKAVPASPSTQQKKKPVLQSNIQQSQAPFATSPVAPAKIGGISSPFGATNINSSPILGGATPQEIGTTATQLQSLPKAMPDTGATTPDMTQSLKDLKATIPSMQSIDDIKGAFPEFSNLDDSVLLDLVETTKNSDNYEDILSVFPELQQKTNTQEKTTIQKIATPFVRFARGVADVGAGIQEGIDTGLSKLGILPDQTAINKKARIRDEEMTQQILGKKAGYEQYVQEGGRIAGSFIANAPANKFGTVGKVALGAAEGLLGGATYNLSTGEGVGSPVNLGLSTAIGAAVPGIVPAFKAIKGSLPGVAKGVKNIIPGLQKTAGQKAEGLAVQGLLNANDAKKIVRTLKETGEGDVGSLGRRALERGIAGKTTEQAIDTAKEIASKNYQGVRSAISEISDMVGTLAKDDAVAKAMTMVGKQADNINNRVGFNAVDITEIDELGRKALNGELTLLDKQRSKELIDEFVNIFKKSGEVSDTQIADVAATLRNKIKNSIEDIVDYTTQGKVNIREMNREVAVAKAFEQGIQNKATANELKQFAIQGIAGGVASNQGDFTTPEGIGKFFLGAFMGRQVGKLLGDPAVLGKIAKVVDKLSAGSRKGLLEFIKKPTQEVPEALLKEIVPLRNEIKNLALPLLKNVDTPNLPMASATNNKALLKGTNIANTPKPTLKTPPITVEKGAIGMGTPKVNNTPVIPPKATVAPSVGAPKKVVSKYIPGETDISNYSLGEYRDLVKEQYPGIHTENDIQRMYKTLQDEGTITKAPKKGMPKLGKETLEQNLGKIDSGEYNIVEEAKKYKTAEDFRMAHQSKSLLDLSDPKRQRYGRLLEDGVDEDTNRYMDLVYTTDKYADQYKYYPDSKVPKVTNPNQEVTIYRGTTAKQGEMMPGDFVTFSKDYALSHNDGAKLLTKKVPAKDVVRQGNDFSEWIYSPESIRGKEYKGGLEAIREQANKKPLPPLPKKGLSKLGKETLEQNINNNDLEKVFEYTKSGAGEKVMPLSRQKEVSKSLSSFPKNKEKVYAGLTLDSDFIYDNLYDGGVFESKRLLSSSTDRNIAESFMDYNEKGLNKVLLEIDGGGSDISSVSRYGEKSLQGEKEILFPIGSKFKVEKVDDGHYKLKFIEKKPLPPLPKKGLPKLGKEISEQNVTQGDDLIQEAKKYKSADDFINDHKKLFHTTSESNAQRIDAEGFIEGKSQGIGDRLVDGVFFVDNEMPLSTITRYSKEPSKIIEGFVSRGSKIKEFKTVDNFEDFLLKDKKYLDLENADLSSKRAKEIFIENGIDVVIKPYGKGTEYIVVNPKVLRTKSQLKQIREEANKKTLPPLPKKGK